MNEIYTSQTSVSVALKMFDVFSVMLLRNVPRQFTCYTQSHKQYRIVHTDALFSPYDGPTCTLSES